MSARLLGPPKNGRYPFRYRSAAQTDIRLSFARERRRLARERRNGKKKKEKDACAG